MRPRSGITIAEASLCASTAHGGPRCRRTELFSAGDLGTLPPALTGLGPDGEDRPPSSGTLQGVPHPSRDRSLPHRRPLRRPLSRRAARHVPHTVLLWTEALEEERSKGFWARLFGR